MLDPTTLVVFVGASLALLVIPGPAVIYVMARSATHGRRSGMISVLGVETGTFVYAAAAALGLTGLIAASEHGYTVVKYAGAAYLIWLGVRALLGSTASGGATQPTRPARLYLDGLLVQLLNPKIAVFFLAFLPQFVDPSAGSVVVQTLLLGTLFTIIAVMTDATCALVAGFFRGALADPRRQRRMGRISGCVYILLGLVAAFTGRPVRA